MMFEPNTSVTEIIQRLRLEPLPGEGGYWGPGIRISEMNSIFFLMTSAADGFSALHRLGVTEGWQWLAGAPAEMSQIDSAGVLNVLKLSAEDSQAIVPPGSWQGARTLGEWTLVSCWCAPAFTEETFELGVRADLLAEFPQHEKVVLELTR
jgi:predicted cupin superfamily sugar epimerase